MEFLGKRLGFRLVVELADSTVPLVQILLRLLLTLAILARSSLSELVHSHVLR